MIKKIFSLLLFMLAVNEYTFSQSEVKRTFGLSASFQSSDFSIQLPVWIGSKGVLGPSVYIKTVEGAGTDFGIGFVSRFFISGEKLKPYAGLKFGALFYTPPSGSSAGLQKSTTDIILGLAFGGEYFFDPHFSVGVEAQVNYVQSDVNSTRFGSPGKTGLNSASAITANIYFGK